MDERPARIEDIRDIPLALFLVGFQQGVGEPPDDASGVVEVEKDGTDAIGPHRPDAVG